MFDQTLFVIPLTRFSSDGGNVTAAVSRQTDEERLPGGLDAHAARTRSLLRHHTAARHYRSLAPYVRPFRRLAQRWQEDRLLRGLKTMEAVLRWAEARDLR